MASMAMKRLLFVQVFCIFMHVPLISSKPAGFGSDDQPGGSLVNVRFEEMKRLWQENKCVFPDISTYEPQSAADALGIFSHTKDFPLKICSVVEELPESDGILRRNLCEAFFSVSETLCIKAPQVQPYLTSSYINALVSDSKWSNSHSVCTSVKALNFNILSFLSQNSDTCERCMSDPKLAPVARLLVAAVTRYSQLAGASARSGGGSRTGSQVPESQNAPGAASRTVGVGNSPQQGVAGMKSVPSNPEPSANGAGTDKVEPGQTPYQPDLRTAPGSSNEPGSKYNPAVPNNNQSSGPGTQDQGGPDQTPYQPDLRTAPGSSNEPGSKYNPAVPNNNQSSGPGTQDQGGQPTADQGPVNDEGDPDQQGTETSINTDSNSKPGSKYTETGRQPVSSMPTSQNSGAPQSPILPGQPNPLPGAGEQSNASQAIKTSGVGDSMSLQSNPAVDNGEGQTAKQPAVNFGAANTKAGPSGYFQPAESATPDKTEPLLPQQHSQNQPMKTLDRTGGTAPNPQRESPVNTQTGLNVLPDNGSINLPDKYPNLPYRNSSNMNTGANSLPQQDGKIPLDSQHGANTQNGFNPIPQNNVNLPNSHSPDIDNAQTGSKTLSGQGQVDKNPVDSTNVATDNRQTETGQLPYPDNTRYPQNNVETVVNSNKGDAQQQGAGTDKKTVGSTTSASTVAQLIDNEGDEEDEYDDDDAELEHEGAFEMDQQLPPNQGSASVHQLVPEPHQPSISVDGVQQLSQGVNYEEAPVPSGHFMAYFITAVVLCVAGYVIYHNKQKIFAIVLEGRRDGQRRRSGGGEGGSNAKYSKLQPTVEEVVPALEKSTTSKNYIY